eukprot:jgi/Tetstr1/435848/TSEL_024736.t1
MASGIGEVRLYHNTANTIPVGVYDDITSQFTVGSTSDAANLVKGGLSPGTQYWFWVEVIDVAGNESAILPLGSITTAAADDVWLFYSTGSTFGTQCINRFYYNGAAGEGGTYSLNYDHVTLYDNNENKGVLPENGDGSASDTAVVQQGSNTALTMNSTLESGYAQLAWGSTTASVAEPKLVLSIRIPGDYSTKVPMAGWSWNQGAINSSQLGSWIIFRNGAQMNHTGTNNPGGNGHAFRDIKSL